MRAAPHSTQGLAAIRHLLATAVKERSVRFLRNLKRAIKRPASDPIHDLRVSVRRLAAALLVTKDVCKSKSADAVLSQLDTLMRPLGKLRDAQVQIELLNVLSKREKKVVSAFLALLEERESRFRTKSRKAMNRLNVARIKTGCKRVRAEMGDRRDNMAAVREAATKAAYRILLRCYNLVQAYRRQAISRRDLKALHKMRLALKRLRYTAEVLRPALPGLGDGQFKLFGRFQTYMGDIHDLDLLANDVKEFYRPKVSNAVLQVARRLARQCERTFAQFKRSFVRMEKDEFWRIRVV